MRLIVTVSLVCALASPVLAAEGNGPEFNAPAAGRAIANAERAGSGQSYQDTQGGRAAQARGVTIVQAGDGPITLGYTVPGNAIADAR